MANRISRTTIVLIAAILALACLFVGAPKNRSRFNTISFNYH
ncbi:hypothetical protein BMD_1036 [Priestia megaterium DSM 319]|uniref:Uncharacterized protein n=1 Tax=Priestia megaterium (strain DSM 319 / IMG 1521) TaxID=592022 RepID=D5DBB5_PRIM3|nr:hypothetical protein [Priestia megaterium]ADF37897.1 hypothetical protein BMD_1036 [Priestia megaterium DSM 319]